MGGNEVDGYYTIQRALELARNSEGVVDPSVSSCLERSLRDVWARLEADSDTYILTKDEFALFNYFRHRFTNSNIAQRAVQRFWDNYQGDYRDLRTGAAAPDRSAHPSSDPAQIDCIFLDLRTSIQPVLANPIDAEVGFLPRAFNPRRHTFYFGIGDDKLDACNLGDMSNVTDVGASRCVANHMGHFTRMFYVALTAAFLFNVSTAAKRASLVPSISQQLSDNPSVSRRAGTVAASLMDVFQVSTPITIPSGLSSQCQQTLMVYSFGNSYGKPFVGQYQPPQCDFNRVVMNFTVTSSGRQFDRLALMYLNDTEIWRTSTAEPTLNGIVWTYMKDVSNYLPLWKQPQKVIFDLGNIIDKTYSGPFNTTLTATFFSTPDGIKPADLIIPLSARRSVNNSASSFMVPEVPAINKFSIPRNVKRAVFSISACGQMDEEFWWSNVPASTTATFLNNTLLGYSPFREVQLLIDGGLAGVSWPFPVIFTGGVVPGFWRPEVGIDAYDLKEDEIDLTPWLYTLSDGKDHTYEIRVVGLADDGQGNTALTTVGGYWVVTGKMFLWLDTPGSVTKGTSMTKLTPNPQFFVTSGTTKSSNGTTNTTLTYQVLAQRQLSFTSTIETSDGPITMSWEQTLQYSNIGKSENMGNNQTNNQMTSGVEVSSNGFSRKFSYPLFCFSSLDQDPISKSMGISGIIDRSKNIQVLGASVFPTGLESYPEEGPFDGMSLTTRQNGTAGYNMNPTLKQSISWGATEQNYVFSGVMASRANYPQVPFMVGSTPLYTRDVLAVNGSVAKDSLTSVPENDFEEVDKSDVLGVAMMSAGNFVGGKYIRDANGWQ